MPISVSTLWPICGTVMISRATASPWELMT